MKTTEMQLIAKVAKAKNLKIAALGLRFDRVVIRLIEELHEFAGKTVATGITVLVSLTAPIRLPAKTAAALKALIESLVLGKASRQEKNLTINGNRVRIRVLVHSFQRAPRLLGFVQNRSSNSSELLDFVEQWIFYHE